MSGCRQCMKIFRMVSPDINNSIPNKRYHVALIFSAAIFKMFMFDVSFSGSRRMCKLMLMCVCVLFTLVVRVVRTHCISSINSIVIPARTSTPQCRSVCPGNSCHRRNVCVLGTCKSFWWFVIGRFLFNDTIVHIKKEFINSQTETSNKLIIDTCM